ncbi:MAG: cadherin-like beta sandwich domain-containing protein [Clostridia bacterium]|nr:cadherin-like beta sandwich domain-containing protein [Clostridia bacterium]
MKQKMKHLVSFIALVAMLVSMFSVCVFPAAAATADEYGTLLNEALVVDPDWADCKEGDSITFTFQGRVVKDYFDSDYYFASFDDAWAKAKEEGKSNPVILLCAGDYIDPIYVDSGVTLLGPNAGIDPNVKSAAKDQPWILSDDRAAVEDENVAETEAVIRTNVYVKKAAANGNITIDGLRFDEPIYTVEKQYGVGGALVDYERNTGASEITVKNTVFAYAGNTDEAHGFALYLRSKNHARTLRLENLYITGDGETMSGVPTPGFISPYFTQLYADNIAYMENKNGFLASTYFALGVSPVVEITNSCFYNTKYNTAAGYVISMDNLSFDFDFYSSKTDRLFTTTGDTEVAAYSGDKRPAATLELSNNVFYNASGKTGVIHYEFINARSVVDIQNNYIYQDDSKSNNGRSVLDAEFVANSASVDQSGCIVIKNNQLIGAYKIPSLSGANRATVINMSDNYFANTLGQVVYQPIYVNEDATRLKRTNFWVDEEMTISQKDWYLSIDNWALNSVDNSNYTANLIFYTETPASEAPISYSSSDGFEVQLYRSATVSSPDGVVLAVEDWAAIPNNKLTKAYLNEDPYKKTTIYAKVTNPEYPDFAPVYTITVENMGSIEGLPTLSESFGEEYFIYKPTLTDVAKGTVVPAVWKNDIYICEAGTNIFSSTQEISDAAAAKSILEPTILIPAGDYYDELVISGTCKILGEQYGINPNYKPKAYEDLTKANYLSSGWTLNSQRGSEENGVSETTFHNVIRVAETADNYRITIDGIEMKDGCSYADDYPRTGECTTIFQNVYADNAGGGLNRNGSANGQVFNFNKPYDANATYRSYMYMYDCRLDNFVGRTAFGPIHDKFVLDGTFYGNATGGSKFIIGIRSNDIANPYYAITNSCIWNNAGSGQASFYSITTGDTNGVLAKKTNIVYNFDGNMWYNPVPTGFGGMEIIFTGSNMTFYMTNNTWVHTSNSGVFFASTIGSTRFRGNCPSENVSDMIVFRRNRQIGMNCLPTTGGTGNGTMFDFSGNYFASTVGASSGLAPAQAWRQEVSESSVKGTVYTYEQVSRVKVDYTYLDWDMTVRSDTGATSEPTSADYTVSAGKFGTGRLLNGVYRDTVPAGTTEYTNPIIPAVYATAKVLDATRTEVSTMVLTGSSTNFYVVVASNDGTKSVEVPVVIEREVGNGSDLITLDDAYIDNATNTVTVYTSLESWQKYRPKNVVVSAGATYALYETEDLGTAVSSLSPKQDGYIMVTGEDGSKTVYTIKFQVGVNPTTIATAALASVEGMTKVDDITFETKIASAEESFTFTPVPAYGTTLKVEFNGNEIKPAADGSYTVAVGGNGTQSATVYATSGDGSNTVVYTLNINKGAGSGYELISLDYDAGMGQVNTAVKTSAGYVISLGASETAVIKPVVSLGAVVTVYEDAACTVACPGNVVNIVKDGEYRDGFPVYVKISAEDGSGFATYKVTVTSAAGNRTAAVIKGTVNKTDYVASSLGKAAYDLYLPAGATSVVLNGAITIPDTRVDGGTVTFFADPARTVPIVASNDGSVTVKLDQKVTTIYTTTQVATYAQTASDGTVLSVKVPASNGVLNIYSDRAVVNYKDAASYQNHWVKPYVDALNNGNYGIFQGDNGSLNVESNVTRYEVATIAARVMGLDVSTFTAGYAATAYADTIADWAAPYVRAVASVMVMNGHLEGDQLIFAGDTYATREQVIKVLVSVCVIKAGGSAVTDASGNIITDAAVTYYNSNKASVDLEYAKYTFADEASVSEWAKPYIRLAATEFDMIHGSSDNGKLYLNPQWHITRAEIIKMVSSYMAG